jgi:hypothetical protein
MMQLKNNSGAIIVDRTKKVIVVVGILSTLTPSAILRLMTGIKIS